MPKQKNIKLKRRLSLAAAVAMVASAIMPAASTFAYWPDRDTTTSQNPPSDVVFNSIIDRDDNGQITRNEEQFVYIREFTGDNSLPFETYTNDKFKVEPGKTYQVMIYYHNNGATNKNFSYYEKDGKLKMLVNWAGEYGGSAVAYDARMRSKYPSVVTNDKSANYQIIASISAANMKLTKDGQPIAKDEDQYYQVGDTLDLATDSNVPVSLRYVDGSARIYNMSTLKNAAGESYDTFGRAYFDRLLSANNQYKNALSTFNIKTQIGDLNGDGKYDKADIIAKYGNETGEAKWTEFEKKMETNYQNFLTEITNKYADVMTGMYDFERDENGNDVFDDYGIKGGKDISGKYLFVDDVKNTKVGQLLGFSDKFCANDSENCGLNGVLPGCAEYSGYVMYLLRAEALDSVVSKSASLDGENFYPQVDAKPGDTVTYRVEWTNTSTNSVESGFKDKLPEGVTLVPGSFKSCAIIKDGDMENKCSAANYKTDDATLFEHTMNDSALTDGIQLGTYAPRQGFVVMYKTTVDAKNADGTNVCVDKNIINTAFVNFNKSGSTSDNDRRVSSATASVVVRTNCSTTETVTELPKTGPGEIALALVAAVCVTVGGAYWYTSQKELVDAPASKKK
jgi:uncharacterized repeat protein (TIGR01451 family)